MISLSDYSLRRTGQNNAVNGGGGGEYNFATNAEISCNCVLFVTLWYIHLEFLLHYH